MLFRLNGHAYMKAVTAGTKYVKRTPQGCTNELINCNRLVSIFFHFIALKLI